MTATEKTIAYFQEQNCKSTTTVEIMKFNCRAISALQKTVHMTVNSEKYFYGYIYKCPACGMTISRKDTKYCDDCGQALNWSNCEQRSKRAK